MSVIRLQLKDPRVDITLDDNDGCTPLWLASSKGRYEVFEWLVASGRDLGDIENKKGRYAEMAKTTRPSKLQKKCKRTEVVSLLERFIANPTQTRQELCMKLGMLDELAAEVFALVVYLCDELLQFTPASHLSSATTAAATRFFAIAAMLPMELQMIL